MLLDKVVPADLTVEVTIDFQANTKSRDAGLLFRTTGGLVGYDAQRGYFAGLIPATGRVIPGKHDGRTWTEITRADVAFDPVELQRLGITVVNDRIVVSLAGQQILTATDATYATGTVGLRVVDTQARFSDLKISGADEPVRKTKVTAFETGRGSKAADRELGCCSN